MKRKWLTALVALMLVLAACGDGDDSTETTAENGDTTETTEAMTDGGEDITLRVFAGNVGDELQAGDANPISTRWLSACLYRRSLTSAG